MTSDRDRMLLVTCLRLACARVADARLNALKTTFTGLRSKSDASSLEAIESASERLKHEEARRIRILAALSARNDITKAA